MSETKADVEYHKLPKDFDNLHNLKDLVQYRNTALSVQQSLQNYSNNINKYVDSFLDNFLMTLDQVLQFIPETSWNDYKVTVRGEDNFYKSYIDAFNGRNNPKDKLPLPQKLESYNLANYKAFLVNTVDKQINPCYWAVDLGWKEFEAIEQQCYVKYKSGRGSSDIQNNKLLISPRYEYTKSIHHYPHGPRTLGHWYEQVTRYDYDVYEFCISTNKYLGIKPSEPETFETSYYTGKNKRRW